MNAEKERHVEQQEEEHYGTGIVRKQNEIEALAAERSGIHEETIKTAFNAVWDTICHELEIGNSVKLHGKGRFYLSKRSSRVGRNPSTGEEYDVPEREAMAFSTSPAYAKRLRKRRKELSERINNVAQVSPNN